MHLKLTFITALFCLILSLIPSNLLAHNIQPVADSAGVYSSRGNGQITVAINNGILTGVYEYYDKWDEQYKEYRDINVFYIYGATTDGITYKITTGWPINNEKLAGSISFGENNKKLKIILNKQPDGYASFDFTANTAKNTFLIKTSNKAKEIRLVKPSRATLYNYDGKLFAKRKGYLVKANSVTLLNITGNYAQVSYRSPETEKIAVYWIRLEDLYGANPALW